MVRICILYFTNEKCKIQEASINDLKSPITKSGLSLDSKQGLYKSQIHDFLTFPSTSKEKNSYVC